MVVICTRALSRLEGFGYVEIDAETGDYAQGYLHIEERSLRFASVLINSTGFMRRKNGGGGEALPSQ